MSGLYVHLPWCVRKCPYCDFNSHPLRTQLPEAEYLHALLDDFGRERRRAPFAIRSVYFGGGTPSLFPPRSFARLLDAFCVSDDVEVTLEANPGTVETAGPVADYASAGINRVSLGVQSFDDGQLRSLGRIHDGGDAERAARAIGAAGFREFNIDLMFGLTGQSVESALADLERAVALEPTHVSWYQLTIEPRTEFARRPPELPDPDTLADIAEAGQALEDSPQAPAGDPPGEASRSSALVSAPACGGGKRFVCLCEDVTDVDVETSLAEGYDHLELLKRYTTIGMGPCQGRMCNLHGIRLCAGGTGRSVQETGRTTARPPATPVSLGALAGQKMEPVQLSAMHDWHVARGARMMTAGTWLRPERYGPPSEEVAAVRNAVGLIDVSPLGKLRLTGPGVPDLLERLYVNSWRDLRRGRVRYGMMCNDEGVVLDDGVCARLADDDWYVSTTSTGAAGALEWVEWWRQSGWGDGVHVTDLTEARAAVNLAGPASREVLQKLTSRDLSKARFPYMRARSTRIAGLSCLVLRIGFTGELSYEIHGPAGGGQYLWEALMEAGEEHGIRPFGVEAQRILRLEKGHLIVGQDTDALSDAISADSGWAVKLEKEDFLGKRALTRVAETGPKQRLVGFRMTRDDAAVEEGLQIVTRRSGGGFDIIGFITSCRRSPTLGGVIGLCWLPAGLAAEAGTPFSVYAGGRLEEGRVHHGAFYDPAGERLRS